MIRGTITLLKDCHAKWLKESSNIKAYKVYFKYDQKDHYVRDYISSYVALDIKKSSIYVGEKEFYSVPEIILNVDFEGKYGKYFSDYKIYIINPNLDLIDKISLFNRNIKTNDMRKKYGKELVDNFVFSPKDLIENSELSLAFSDAHEDEDSETLIFFTSKFIDSKAFVKKYFESKNIRIIDETS